MSVHHFATDNCAGPGLKVGSPAGAGHGQVGPRKFEFYWSDGPEKQVCGSGKNRGSH